jgi:serine/threonine-protein kinase
VKLLDFGIATAADRLARTQAGQVKGKYPYMSPEQCRGNPLDRRSDLFSLGTVLYELSTVRRLFKRENELETATAITQGEITPPSKLIPGYPASLEAICLKALARSREERFQSAAEMRRAFAAVVREQEGSTGPVETLASVMRKLFPDRIEEKRAMLRKIAQGSTVTHVPIAEPDEHVELQAAAVEKDEASAKIMTRERPAGASSRRAWMFGGIGAAVVAVVATGLLAITVAIATWARSSDRAKRTASFMARDDGTSARDARAPVRTSTTAAPARVTIDVSSEPPGAVVSIAGVTRGETPISIPLDESAAPITLDVSREGFMTVRETLIPDRDQRVRIVLVAAAPEPKQEPAARPRPRKEKTKKPYRRFE